MIARHYALLCALLLAAHITGCASHRPAPDERATASLVPGPMRLDSSKVENLHFATVYGKDASTSPGILSGIGSLFSTPAGTANRRAVRLARATGPRKLGKGAVYAPQAKQVVNAYKPTAAVVLADSGATVTAIDKVKAPVAIGSGATATQVAEKKNFLASLISGIGWWWLLLIPAAYAGWRVYRSTIPFA